MSDKSVPAQLKQGGCLPFFLFLSVLGGVYLLAGETGDREAGLIIVLFLFIAAPVLGFLVRTLFTRTKASQVERAEDILARDNRKPVFYLRSFDADKHQHQKIPVGHYLALAANPLALLVFAGRIIPNFEQRLSMICGQIGPVIALARPGSGKTLGAARLAEARDEDWKDIVSDYLDKSRLVIMRAGETEGLLWEINKIFSSGMLDRLLIIIDFEGETDQGIVQAKYAKFARQVREATGIILPEKIGKNRYLYFPGGTGAAASPFLSESIAGMGFDAITGDGLAVAKGWVPAGWNSARLMGLARRLPRPLALPTGLLFSLTVAALVTRWSWYGLAVAGDLPGAIVLISGGTASLAAGILAAKTLARFRVKRMRWKLLGGLFAGAWAYLWFMDGYVWSGRFGEYLTDFAFANSFLADQIAAEPGIVIFLILVGLFFLVWPLLFLVYGLTDFEEKLAEART